MYTIIFDIFSKRIIGVASYEATLDNFGSYLADEVAFLYQESLTLPVSRNYLLDFSGDEPVPVLDEVPASWNLPETLSRMERRVEALEGSKE